MHVSDDEPLPPPSSILCIFNLNVFLQITPLKPQIFLFSLELETKVHLKVSNHGKGPYKGLLLVESVYYRFHI